MTAAASLRYCANEYRKSDTRRRRARLLVAEVDHYRRRTEPVGLVSDVDQSDREPDASDGLGDDVEVDPDQAAEKETDNREQRIAKKLGLVALLPPDSELPEAGKIYAHEG